MQVKDRRLPARRRRGLSASVHGVTTTAVQEIQVRPNHVLAWPVRRHGHVGATGAGTVGYLIGSMFLHTEAGRYASRTAAGTAPVRDDHERQSPPHSATGFRRRSSWLRGAPTTFVEQFV